MVSDSDNEGKRGETPPNGETRLYSTPGDPNLTIDSGGIALTPPGLDDLAVRFELVSELGRGGMGVVYKARDKETGGIVALKVLRPEIANDPALIERFKNELLLARKITHGRVCRTFDLHRFGRTAAITMEFVEGDTLRYLFSRVGAVAVGTGIKWARQICDGLREAHRQEVVHRDLKPENIMLDAEGGIKIMDFGIARSLGGGTTQTEGVSGTPAYMSPEQADAKKVDHRTDIYSLGLILYELFTGDTPFKADTPVAVALKQIRDLPPSPRQVEPDLPPHIEKTILRCLEKNPEKRFQSIDELSDALTSGDTYEMRPVSQNAEPEPPPHLSVWQKADWVLLAVGVVGLAYFLGVRDLVFPASHLKLEVDSITARQNVEALAADLDRELPPYSWASLTFDDEAYRDSLLLTFGDRPKDPDFPDVYQTLREIDLPLHWRVGFSNLETSLLRALGEGSETTDAATDRRGGVVDFSVLRSHDLVLPRYKPAPTEQRRAIAVRAAEGACGSMPEVLRPVETQGGEAGAFYSVRWVPDRPVPGAPWAEVSLEAERVNSVACAPEGADELSPTIRVLQSLTRGLGYMFRVGGLIGLLFAFIKFSFGHSMPGTVLFWKRLPLAVVLGFASIWVIYPSATGSPPSYLFLLGGGLAAGGLVLLVLVFTEQLILRRSPQAIASYRLALRGRVGDRAVGMAVIRGALAGLVVAGTETLLVHLSLIYVSGSKIRLADGLGVVFVNPEPLANAMASFSPALFVLGAALVSGIFVGVIILGVNYVNIEGDIRKSKYPRVTRIIYMFVVGFFYPAVAIALLLPQGRFLSLGVGHVYAVFIPGLILASVMLRYDILTVFVAVATATIWSLNYPLLYLLSEVGNTGQWLVFIGWGVLVGLGLLVGFRTQFDQWRRQLAEEF